MQNQELHNLPQDAFHKACEEGKLEECQVLYKSNPNIINQLHSIHKSVGLQWAVQNSQIDVVAWLLKQANIELFIDRSKKCFFR